ncbi:DUF935 family protein [Calidifontibacter sp. DB0510]|uniref:DUF935 family protein n=2 Tax=Metallococcus carri TaxID=1656884 RepID=A0A967B535_9MICO|nr:DUF935 family protein [Metallococcus carri]NOP38529.1 DUF935 family protein [Calidifontibacter sp. DB2511S]
MRRTDAQCTSVLRGLNLPLLRTPWRLDPNGAKPEVVALVAEDLGLPVKGEDSAGVRARSRDRFSWKAHLASALLMLPLGFMPFEQVYRLDDRGRARLWKLGPRHPRTITDMKVARDGGLVSITQSGTKNPIPVRDLVMYVHEREAGNWLGTSVLRPAYKNWLIKDRLLRVQAQTIDRNGMGVPRYTAAENETDLEPGKKLATAWRSGESAGASIPYGAKLDLVGVQGTLPDADKVIRYHDEQIARSVLAHFLNLGTQTGSWALGSTFADFFTMSLQAIADQVADTATQHVVEDLVDLNWGPDEPSPRLVCDEIGSQSDATAAAIKLLVDAGVLTPDEAVEKYVRTKFQLPEKEPA